MSLEIDPAARCLGTKATASERSVTSGLCKLSGLSCTNGSVEKILDLGRNVSASALSEGMCPASSTPVACWPERSRASIASSTRRVVSSTAVLWMFVGERCFRDTAGVIVLSFSDSEGVVPRALSKICLAEPSSSSVRLLLGLAPGPP